MKAIAKSSTPRPDITKCHDYFAFLKDWTEYMKSARPGFSLRTLARDAGLAVGYLPMVFSGQRRLSEKAFEKILPHLGLSAVERRVLEKLRVIGESENVERREQALRELQRSARYREDNPQEWEVHRYLSHWLHVAIRELAQLTEFREDPAWIQERLRGKFSRAEIEKALQFLEGAGFLQRTKDGLRGHKKVLQCEDGIFKMSLGGFHRQMLEEASKSIEDVARADRLLMGHTKAMSREQFERLKEKITQFVREIENEPLVVANSPAEVYHIEVATFPLTKAAAKERVS